MNSDQASVEVGHLGNASTSSVVAQSVSLTFYAPLLWKLYRMALQNGAIRTWDLTPIACTSLVLQVSEGPDKSLGFWGVSLYDQLQSCQERGS